jgi:hypothetical protein
MRTKKPRPVIKVRAYYDGAGPFLEAYADVFALQLQRQGKAKSPIRTFENSKLFHYDYIKNQKERVSDGN